MILSLFSIVSLFILSWSVLHPHLHSPLYGHPRYSSSYSSSIARPESSACLSAKIVVPSFAHPEFWAWLLAITRLFVIGSFLILVIDHWPSTRLSLGLARLDDHTVLAWWLSIIGMVIMCLKSRPQPNGNGTIGSIRISTMAIWWHLLLWA